MDIPASRAQHAVKQQMDRAATGSTSNPRIAVPTGLSPDIVQSRATRAHESLSLGLPSVTGLRDLVRDSWARSLSHHADPEAASPVLVYDGGELDEYRNNHPLSAVMPVIHQLLVRHTHDSGLIVAVGDEHGRLLWVDGDTGVRRKAEDMYFVAGADWSESQVGTSAPGTALELDHGIQISGAEHFNRTVHPWSCTAVPLHDPDSGSVLGVVDITGGAEAVAQHTLSLVEAAVVAAQSHLRVERLQRTAQSAARNYESLGLAGAALHPAGPVGGAASGPRSNIADGEGNRSKRRLYQNSLQVLGRNYGQVSIGGTSGELSQRHAEILTLLSWYPDGLSSQELSSMIYPADKPSTALRPEMVRLRKVLEKLDPSMVPQSRPYRLPEALVVDGRQVLNYLWRGSHRMALQIYKGPLLPLSEAPAIIELRDEISFALREAVLNDGGPEALLQYAQLPEAADDATVWEECLKVLPARSPKRATVVARLEKIEAELRG